MKRPFLTLATTLVSLAFLTSACTHSSDSTTTDTSGAGAAATSTAGAQSAAGPQSSGGAMGGAMSGGAMSGGGSGRGGAGRMMGKILMGLGLSDDQKAQIKTLRADFQAKNKGLQRGDPARLANMKDYYAKIDAVLTPAQRDAFHAKMKAMRAKYQQQQGQTQQQPQQPSQ
jgi:Spy/CpxP family protein refolding chaperone